MRDTPLFTPLFMLGVRIDPVSREDARGLAKAFLQGETSRTIFTPNPEMLVDACRNSRFREALNAGSLNLCDGTGIALFSGGRLGRIPGADFMLDICHMANDLGASVYLLGSLDSDVISDAKKTLYTLFPGLRIVGCDVGPRDLSHDEESREAVRRIVAASPAVLFVGFGHGRQEPWILRHLHELPSVRIAMGVGGAFDMLSGRLRRAPVFFRRLGIEWVWRLLQQPRRIGRIGKAVLLFPFLLLFHKHRSI